VCRWCGGPIVRCQGKDGPNALLVWRQHHRFPLNDPLIADECLFDEAALRGFTLPGMFTFIGYCDKGEPTWMAGRCKNGVWVATEPADDPAANR
jgi:hypothetical protein